MPEVKVYSRGFSVADLFTTGKKNYRVAELDEISINEIKLVKVKGKRIVLCRGEEGYYALNDKCPHKGHSLSRGVMICNTLTCIMHGSQFDVKTGGRKAGPAQKDVEKYKVVEQDGGVYILV